MLLRAAIACRQVCPDPPARLPARLPACLQECSRTPAEAEREETLKLQLGIKEQAVAVSARGGVPGRGCRFARARMHLLTSGCPSTRELSEEMQGEWQ